ncbi:MAG: hypothetical protein JWN01_417 [Patescibacteria group bacterium]|nr:hypothetical protein [Patescibacteria group bacterium]
MSEVMKKALTDKGSRSSDTLRETAVEYAPWNS